MSRVGSVLSTGQLAFMRGSRRWSGPGKRQVLVVSAYTDDMPPLYVVDEQGGKPNYRLRIQLKPNPYL